MNKSVAIALMTALLTACGGGGSSTPADPAAPAPAPSPGNATATRPGSTPGPAPAPSSWPAAGSVVFQHSGCSFVYTIPTEVTATGLDPLRVEQWHLQNTGQKGGVPGEDLRVLPVWAGTRGEQVQVAVADDAVDILHEDLFQNVVPGASTDYVYGGNYPLPCTTANSHGTSVAGIIAARDDNGTGVAGVAPRARLIANNMLQSSTVFDGADAMTLALSTTGIYHNSWGSPDDGFLNDSDRPWEQAVETGIATGRGGKGAVYVFASGNGKQVLVPTTGGGNNVTTENSNFDGYVNKRGVIAVCATDDHGHAAWYSEPGANLLVCAPSGSDAGTVGIATTAMRNAYLQNTFSGTSAAAPMVSGVVALMLAANPQLSWRDVRWLLAQTAREVDPTDPSWTTSAIQTPAGTAKRFSHRFGFGVADATAAVASARNWTSVGDSSTLKTCGPYARAPGAAIPDATGASVTDAVVVSGCAITQIEFVEVTFNADDHPYGADLTIRLQSPAARISELADRRACGSNVAPAADPCRSIYNDWRFGSSRHLGEAANGSWQLQVTDGSPSDSGTFKSWSLRLHGR